MVYGKDGKPYGPRDSTTVGQTASQMRAAKLCVVCGRFNSDTATHYKCPRCRKHDHKWVVS